MFGQLDNNGDGRLTAAELKNSPSGVSDTFSGFKPGKDGFTVEQFTHTIQKTSQDGKTA